MGIFKNITKTLKKAAPLLVVLLVCILVVQWVHQSDRGSVPAAGQDTEQALLNAALAGGTAYAMDMVKVLKN